MNIDYSIFATFPINDFLPTSTYQAWKQGKQIIYYRHPKILNALNERGKKEI